MLALKFPSNKGSGNPYCHHQCHHHFHRQCYHHCHHNYHHQCHHCHHLCHRHCHHHCHHQYHRLCHQCCHHHCFHRVIITVITNVIVTVIITLIVTVIITVITANTSDTSLHGKYRTLSYSFYLISLNDPWFERGMLVIVDTCIVRQWVIYRISVGLWQPWNPYFTLFLSVVCRRSSSTRMASVLIRLREPVKLGWRKLLRSINRYFHFPL